MVFDILCLQDSLGRTGALIRLELAYLMTWLYFSHSRHDIPINQYFYHRLSKQVAFLFGEDALVKLPLLPTQTLQARQREDYYHPSCFDDW